MNAKKSILAVIETDNQPESVVSRAAWLAGVTGCELELVLYDPSPEFLARIHVHSADSARISDAIRQVQSQTIDKSAALCEKQGIRTTTCVATERYFLDAVLPKIEEVQPSFVVKGSRYHPNSNHGLIVDTDWQLMRVCTYPIWLVKTEKIRTRPVVIAAVDPLRETGDVGKRDNTIVENAKHITETADGELHLFHSYHRLIGIRNDFFDAIKPLKLKIDEIDGRIKEKHRDALDSLAQAYGIDAEHVHQLPGHAHELLPTFARGVKSDLVVMGALARWDIKRSAIGSTAERIIDHLPCDVLIVR